MKLSASLVTTLAFAAKSQAWKLEYFSGPTCGSTGYADYETGGLPGQTNSCMAFTIMKVRAVRIADLYERNVTPKSILQTHELYSDLRRLTNDFSDDNCFVTFWPDNLGMCGTDLESHPAEPAFNATKEDLVALIHDHDRQVADVGDGAFCLRYMFDDVREVSYTCVDDHEGSDL